jgi:hypothetical protein
LEEPGGSCPSEHNEADEPGDDNGPELIETAGTSVHVRVDPGVEDIEVVGRIEDGGGQEAKEEV